jgi:Flp pilus assembly pilin Flp
MCVIFVTVYSGSTAAWMDWTETVNKKLHSFLRDEAALSIVEYAIAAGLLVATLAAALLALGLSINTIITTIDAFLAG